MNIVAAGAVVTLTQSPLGKKRRTCKGCWREEVKSTDQKRDDGVGQQGKCDSIRTLDPEILTYIRVYLISMEVRLGGKKKGSI
jgi:hypothetical protein